MHSKLTSRKSTRNQERSIEKHGLYRRERARHAAEPCSIKLKADHIGKWSNTIIQARLRKATQLRRLKVTRLLNSQQMSGFKKMFSNTIDKEEAITAYALAEASNDLNYFETTAKEVLYGAA